VGQSEHDQKHQPQKLSETLKMAWQLIEKEKVLIAAAALLMVRRIWFYAVLKYSCTHWCRPPA
jgi:NhaP-type Na+/H+ or K+/H+ antiporter